MTKFRRYLVIPAVASLPAWALAGAAEPNAVGIVMRVTGDVDPNVPPGAEIAANTSIKLAPDAELMFLHYPPDCELVTVTGGTLKLTRTAFATDGEVRSQHTQSCPRIYQLSGTGGGWVARDLLRVPVDPEIIFAGNRAGEVTEAAIYDAGEPDKLLYRLDLLDRHATRPEDAAPLAPNHRYVLRLSMTDAAESVDYAFTAVASNGANPLVVFHVD